MNLFDLTGKTALITGASQGLGERFAHTLADAGAKVILAARKLDHLIRIARDIQEKGGKAIPVKMDVSDQASVQGSIDGLATQGEVIDILVNNAGIGQSTPIFEADNQGHFEAMIQTNVMGVWYGTKAVANHMKSQGVQGSIVNIASVAGANRFREQTAGYSASKAAVIQMTKALVGELASANIRINCIAPGLVHTPMTDYRVGVPEERRTIEQTIPLRFVADPKDLDGAILYLASNEASRYMTGACITIDGGASWGGFAYDPKKSR
jgi:NAD(P)-dependent dehydrogenase (short-subunit alcohol dehydrogenase family)